MTTAQITKTIILFFACVLLIWDVVVAINTVPGDTISEVVAGWSWRWQSVPFGVGVIAGHLCWPAGYARKPKAKRKRVQILWLVGFAVIVADIWLVGELMPAFPLVAGILAGRLFWAQTPELRSLRYG